MLGTQQKTVPVPGNLLFTTSDQAFPSIVNGPDNSKTIVTVERFPEGETGTMAAGYWFIKINLNNLALYSPIVQTYRKMYN